MPLVSTARLPVNNRKLANKAGTAFVITGSVSPLAGFLPKQKTQTLTIRNVFGDCSTWSDPFSYSDYVNAQSNLDFITPLYLTVTTPYYAGDMNSFVADSSLGPFTDALTGTTSVHPICFVSVSDFTTDIGDIPLPACALIVQSGANGTDTGVYFAGDTRALNVIRT